MNVKISPGKIAGTVSAIPSKSHLHRLLICAALADKETMVVCSDTKADDIKATIDCLAALGAVIERKAEGFSVRPIDRTGLKTEQYVLPCMESGSTLRFMLPVVCALGVRGAFQMGGRLPDRPMAPLDSELEAHGIRLWRDTHDVLCCEGRLVPGEYELPGNISSQYITGLLLALPLLDGDSCLTVTLPLESADYINMTLEAAEEFGMVPEIDENKYQLKGTGGFASPGRITAEGDWSNAAFWLCAGAMPGGDIIITGLKKDSLQGDKEICDILQGMGAELNWDGDILHVKEGERLGVQIDAKAIPDLIPVLSAVAAVSSGVTTVRNAKRLRLKESDRLQSTTKTLEVLGADITETQDGLIIIGHAGLKGGEVNSFGDHRIAMMSAIASSACTAPVILTGAQAVNKSYPTFWEDCAALGMNVTEIGTNL